MEVQWRRRLPSLGWPSGNATAVHGWGRQLSAGQERLGRRLGNCDRQRVEELLQDGSVAETVVRVEVSLGLVVAVIIAKMFFFTVIY